VAVPEAELVVGKRPNRNPTLPDQTLQADDTQPPQLQRGEGVASAVDEADHDPHRLTTSSLPASVLVGLALLPFAIPILWLIVPPLFGQAPMLSVAVPIAIAISASILSLAVIYTIDWSPAVRIKGVLMLLGLAYFVSISLFFLKPEMVEWVKTTFGDSAWVIFTPPDQPGEYMVKMPQLPKKDANYQPVPGNALECYTLSHSDLVGRFVLFTVGAGQAQAGENDIEPGTDRWFEGITKAIVSESQGQLDLNHVSQKVEGPQKSVGREFGIQLADGKTIRVVRVFVIGDRLYYLSTEGTGVTGEDKITQDFLRSFFVRGVRK
jgi:hypothetical protein